MFIAVYDTDSDFGREAIPSASRRGGDNLRQARGYPAGSYKALDLPRDRADRTAQAVREVDSPAARTSPAVPEVDLPVDRTASAEAEDDSPAVHTASAVPEDDSSAAHTASAEAADKPAEARALAL